MAIAPLTLGVPGSVTGTQVTFNTIWMSGAGLYKPGGGLVKTAVARDSGNADGSGILRTGLIMAYNSTDKAYAPFRIGTTTAALAGGGTTLTIGATEAAVMSNILGSSGTFTLTGPPVAGGTVVQTTVTYSAINTSTGAITITAPTSANQVERIRFNISSTGGNLKLTVQKTDGTLVTTANAAWSATDATYLSNIQSALDTATGVSNGIVVSAEAGVDTDNVLVLTYSGTGYAAKPWTPAVVNTFPTSSTIAYYTNLQAAAGSFIAGSWVSNVNYATPMTLIEIPPWPSDMTAVTTTYTDWAQIPMAGAVNVTAILDYPTDSSMKTWLKTQLSTLAGNKFEFSDSIGS